MPQEQTSQTTSNAVSDDVITKFMALAPDKRRAALGRMSTTTKQTLLGQLKARKPGTTTTAQWKDYAKPGPYTTKLAPEEETKFQNWVRQNKVPWRDSPTSDYDMRGYWKAQQSGDKGARTSVDSLDKKPHYPDTWKTPYHKTFSNESQYALPTAGHWEGEKFVAPSKTAVTPETAPGGKGTGWLTEPGGLGRKIEVGAMEGATEPFGIKIPDPNRPSSLTWGSIAHQIVSGLGHQAAESIKQFGPLAPIDFIAKGMEGMAEGVESGVKRTVKGVAKGDPEEIVHGVLGGGVSAVGGIEGMEQAGKIANKISNMPAVPLGKVFSMAKMQAFMDQYVHARGLDLKDTYGKALKKVNAEIERHADALNRAVPKDAIDATDVLTNANKAVDDLVKTPHGQLPELQAIAKSIKNHPPGRWDFETAKQFRSNIASAMRRTVGPLNVSFTKIYADITNKMEAAAKTVKGGQASWDFYNRLTRNFHQNFADHIGDITDADTGAKVSGTLLKDKPLSNEVIKELGKYGLDVKKATEFIKHADDVVKAKKFLGNSIFRYIYRTGAGGAAYIGGHLAGLGYIGSMAPALVAGLTSIYLKNLRVLMELDPSIIEKVAKERELPGPQKVTIQAPPAGAAPQAAAPTGTPPASPAGAGGTPPAAAAPAATATPKIQPLTAAEKLALRKQRAAPSAAGTAAGPGAQASTTGTPSAPSPSATTSYNKPVKTAMELEREELLKKAGAELVSSLDEIKKVEAEAKKPPEVQKVPEGQHGNPQEALREKWRTRKAATREQSVRTEVKTVEEKAIGGGPASAKEFDDLPSVDIEKDLSGDSPEGKTLVTALKKLKAKEGWDDDVYRGHLVEMAKGYAKRMAKRKK